MPSRSSLLLAVLAAVEAIFLLVLLFAVADEPWVGILVLIGTVLLCIVALRLIGAESFGWMPVSAAVPTLVVVNLVALGVFLVRR